VAKKTEDKNDQVTPFQAICWDRGRPASKRANGAQSFPTTPNPFSRFALIAGGTPAVPANHLRLICPRPPLFPFSLLPSNL